MYLKEAFQYQNYLDKLFHKAMAYLQNNAHTLHITELHKRKLANPVAEDIVKTHDEIFSVVSEPHYPIMRVVAFVDAVLFEKEALSAAVDRAKLESNFSMDAAVNVNKLRQQLKDVLGILSSTRPVKVTTRGNDYMVNAEGNQVPYYYEIDRTTEPSFDTAQARMAAKQTASCCQHMSDQIERYLINTVVNFEPSFDMTDSIEDTMAAYMAASTTTLTDPNDEHYIRHAV